MPLTGKAKRLYQREYMKHKRQGLTSEANLSINVSPDWVTNPNRYLASHLRVRPDYNPNQPSDHFAPMFIPC